MSASRRVSALELAAHGFQVFPVHAPVGGRKVCSCGDPQCSSPGKHPATRRGFKDASSGEGQINRWFTDESQLNIGIRTGEPSGIVVLDIDPRNGGDESLRKLLKQHGPLPDAPEVRTGGGGTHYYFRHPGTEVKCRSNIWPGIDLKADGGYVVAAPSLHKSGDHYEWVVGPAEAELPELPQFLLTKRPARKQATMDPFGEVREGFRNASLTSLGGVMIRESRPTEEILEVLSFLNREQCKPPLPNEEVREIVASLQRYRIEDSQHERTAKPFPVDALPKALRNMVEGTCESLGCPEAYVGPAVLGVCAAAIGNSRSVRLKKDWEEPCVLWVALVGDSGSMKSPALKAVMGPLKEIQAAALSRYDEELQQYEDALSRYSGDLKAWRKNPSGDPPAKPVEPIAERYYCNDITVEALADRLRDQPRGLLLFNDELAAWVKGFNQYRGGGQGSDAQKWLSTHIAEPMAIDRKSGQKLVHVPRAAVSVLGGIQPAILKQVLGSEHLENGLAARMLMAYPGTRPQLWSEATIPDSVHRTYAQLIRRLTRLPMDLRSETPRPIEVQLTKEALDYFKGQFNWIQVQMDSTTGPMRSLLSKLKSAVARIALVIHCCKEEPGAQGDARIDLQSIKSAAVIADWFWNEAWRIYGILDVKVKESEVSGLMDFIKSAGGAASRRELMRKFKIQKAELVDQYLQPLVDAGLGSWSDHPGGKRVFALSSCELKRIEDPGVTGDSDSLVENEEAAQ